MRASEHVGEVEDADTLERLAQRLWPGGRLAPFPPPGDDLVDGGRDVLGRLRRRRRRGREPGERPGDATRDPSHATSRKKWRKWCCGLSASWATDCTSPNATCRSCACQNSSGASIVCANEAMVFMSGARR